MSRRAAAAKASVLAGAISTSSRPAGPGRRRGKAGRARFRRNSLASSSNSPLATGPAAPNRAGPRQVTPGRESTRRGGSAKARHSQESGPSSVRASRAARPSVVRLAAPMEAAKAGWALPKTTPPNPRKYRRLMSMPSCFFRRSRVSIYRPVLAMSSETQPGRWRAWFSA